MRNAFAALLLLFPTSAMAAPYTSYAAVRVAPIAPVVRIAPVAPVVRIAPVTPVVRVAPVVRAAPVTPAVRVAPVARVHPVVHTRHVVGPAPHVRRTHAHHNHKRLPVVVYNNNVLPTQKKCVDPKSGKDCQKK